MPLSVRLDASTERLVERLARKRHQTKSEVVRDAIGMLAEQEKGSNEKRRPYELIAHLIGSVRGGPPDLSLHTGEKFKQLLMGRRNKRR
ncbi:MAG: ribbon-helix-helix protein, CopG family [Deltaproteobacteria bacterium]|nr:ribbon-helix-helix protein, CopG family [Deltaproteobacteria bacterium]